MSFVTRMVLLALAFIFVAVLACGFLAYRVSNALLEREIQFAARALVDSLSGASVMRIVDPGEDDAELQTQLTRMLAMDVENRIADAFVVSSDLRVLAAKDASQVGLKYQESGDSLLEDLEEMRVVRVEGSGTRIAAPIQWGKTRKYTLGYIILRLNETAYATARNEIIISFSVMFVSVIIITTLLLRWVLSRALRPVVRLGEAARALSSGDLAYTLEPTRRDDEIGASIRSFLAMREAQAVFAKFSNPALVEEILAGRAPDKPQQVRLSIGFGDGVGFTTWSSKHSAAEISERLSEYFTLLGQSVRHHDGIIEKFIGDAIMSYFGIDSRNAGPEMYGTEWHEEVARNAVLTHLQAQIVLEMANWAFARFHDRHVLEFRFGVATGPCVVGPMGAQGVKLDYTLIGNTVNLASRLEGIAEPGGLVIDNFTYRNANGPEWLRVRGPLHETIKGFAQKVPLYHVSGLQSEDDEDALRKAVYDYFRQPLVIEALQLDLGQLEIFYAELDAYLEEDALTLPIPEESPDEGANYS